MKKSSKLLVFLFSIVFFATCYAAQGNSKQFNTVMAAAQSNPNLSTWVKAVNAAGLQGMLEGKGPFTLFTPTNQAFAALPSGKLEKLMLPKNKQKLRNLLLNHMVSGKVVSTDVKPGEFQALNGEDLDITKKGNALFLDNKAKISKTEINAENGIIHVINAVVVP